MALRAVVPNNAETEGSTTYWYKSKAIAKHPSITYHYAASNDSYYYNSYTSAFLQADGQPVKLYTTPTNAIANSGKHVTLSSIFKKLPFVGMKNMTSKMSSIFALTVKPTMLSTQLTFKVPTLGKPAPQFRHHTRQPQRQKSSYVAVIKLLAPLLGIRLSIMVRALERLHHGIKTRVYGLKINNKDLIYCCY